MELIKLPKHKCSKCECVYTFDKEDLKKEENYIGQHQRTGFSAPKWVYEDNVYVLCPLCGHKHIIISERREE